MTRRRTVVGIVLILWVLLGPIGMAFSGCAMMSSCSAPCALTSCIMPSVSIQVLLPVAFTQDELFISLSSTLMKVPTPPPRSQSASA